MKALTVHLNSADGSETASPWEDCKKYDKAMLKAYSDHGSKEFVAHFNKTNSSNFANGAGVADEWARVRIERVCEFFRDVATMSKDNNR